MCWFFLWETLEEVRRKMFYCLLEEKADLWDLYIKMSEKSSPGFFLDSNLYDDNLGRYSFIGWKPRAVLRSTGRHIEYQEEDKWSNWEQDPLEALEEIRKKHLNLLGSIQDYPFPFSGGLVGYISYDMGKNIQKIIPKGQNDLHMYEQYWGIYDSFVLTDHCTGQMWAVSYSEKMAVEIKNEIHKALKNTAECCHQQRPMKVGQVFSNFTSKDYLEAILMVKDSIQKGELQQANLSQRFSFDFNGNSQKLYEIIRKINPGYFSAFLHFDDCDILSISPERFIKIKANQIETRPIKGTRPRGKNQEEDRQLANELLNSKKDQTELSMIIDLEKNELEKVCQAGSITVKDLYKISTYATVFHLDAIISGKLTPPVSIAEILRNTFPGGSITGTPKKNAMQVIEDLEPTSRGVYTGSIRYIDFRGDCDLNIAIRTAVIKDNYCHYQAGGGLTAASEPAAEYEETLAKAKAFFLSREELLRTCNS